jgi:hypothetical protein
MEILDISKASRAFWEIAFYTKGYTYRWKVAFLAHCSVDPPHGIKCAYCQVSGTDGKYMVAPN